MKNVTREIAEGGKKDSIGDGLQNLSLYGRKEQQINNWKSNSLILERIHCTDEASSEFGLLPERGEITARKNNVSWSLAMNGGRSRAVIKGNAFFFFSFTRKRSNKTGKYQEVTKISPVGIRVRRGKWNSFTRKGSNWERSGIYKEV